MRNDLISFVLIVALDQELELLLGRLFILLLDESRSVRTENIAILIWLCQVGLANQTSKFI